MDENDNVIHSDWSNWSGKLLPDSQVKMDTMIDYIPNVKSFRYEIEDISVEWSITTQQKKLRDYWFIYIKNDINIKILQLKNVTNSTSIQMFLHNNIIIVLTRKELVTWLFNIQKTLQFMWVNTGGFV